MRIPRPVTLALLMPALLALSACSDILAGAEPGAAAPRSGLTDSERLVIELFDRTSPAVVNVESWIEGRSNFFQRSTQELPQGSGSGFLWDRAGHVVTNFHVIQGAHGADVTLHDGSTYPAELVGQYADKDLAVLKIDAPASKLRPITVGTSDDLQVGQMVLAIGNPFGLDHTLTTGVVSALKREVRTFNDRTIQDVIQTDATINPGNSGGPLLDSAGRLIGVNTQIISPTGASVGLGFAIPVDEVRDVVPSLIEHGRILRPQLGVELNVNDSMRFGLQGVLVWTVAENSGAERAGLRPGARRAEDGSLLLGDIIVAADGTPTPDRNALLHVLERRSIGDTVELDVRRGDRITARRALERGEVLTVPVTLQAPR